MITLHFVLINYVFMMRSIIRLFTCFIVLFAQNSFSQTAFDRFLSVPSMKGASISFMVKDIMNDTIVFCYDADRELIPASVMKIVTTAVALEILGEQFRYETILMYDGVIKDSILEGNLYICGSGDPTLGSVEITSNRDYIMREWIKTLNKSGIRIITGSIISDESIFDSEGLTMKSMREDMGSYYGAGSYGINIFDNRFILYLQTATSNDKPEILKTDPPMPNLLFHNYLYTDSFSKDSAYIIGFPFSAERYLYGTLSANRSINQLMGDIPDPSLFLSQYFTELLSKDSIKVMGLPTCYRVLSESNNWRISERKFLISSYSVSLMDIVRITNHVSHNLYADALLKTIGLKYRHEDAASSFDKGISIVKNHWAEKGLNISSLWMFDGSGLAVTNKLTASFICDLLGYMYNQSTSSNAFFVSLPRAGIEGTVSNLLRDSNLKGNLRLKSGSMSRVRSYAGYYQKDDKTYAIALIVNNFSCTQTQMRVYIEHLLLSMF